jgi:predicted acyl esterase
MDHSRPVSPIRVCALCALALWSVSATAQEQFTDWLEMPDGVLLATEIYLPEGAGPWPVALRRTPYGRLSPEQAAFANAGGYAYVAQDIRGTGESGGEWSYANDTVDGHTTVDWIATQPWCDGGIAMGGMSAGAHTTYALAPGAPDEVKALRSEAASPDFYHHAAFQGGAFRWDYAGEWLSAMGFSDLIEQILDHRLLDEYWEPFQWIDRADDVNTPMLHIGGWYDVALQGALDAFAEFQHHGGPGARGHQYLIVGPWTHGTWGSNNQPSLVYPDNATVDLEAVAADFRDFWVKGLPTGVDQWPAVQVYLMGAAEEPDAPGNRWVALRDWPPAASVTPWYLDAGGGLDDAMAPTGQITLTIDPDHEVRTVGGGNLFTASGPLLQYTAEDREDVLTFTSDVLEHPVAIMGPITARIWIEPDTPDLDLSVRLCDVYPQGSYPVELSHLVIDGIQRARMRCGDDRECLLTPGVPTEIEVDLWSTAIVFNAGHQIRVSIAGSNYPRFEVNPNHGGDLNGDDPPVVAYPRILFGPDHPSRILLPAVRLDALEHLGDPIAHPSSTSSGG